MGGRASKQLPEPVEGLEEETRVSVIPVFRTSIRDSYTVPRITTLKLHKSHIWSVDSNILDYRGFYVFRKSGSALSAVLEFSDDAGNILAYLEKKTTCRDSIVTVVLGSSLDPGPSVATIQYRYRASESSASIFIHEFDDENDPDIVFPGAEIRVQGNFNKYHYTFFLDDTKIAQVVASDTQMYSLEIGPWMDIAFITICASAIDLLHVRARLSPWDNVCHLITSLGCQDDTEHDIAVQTNVI